MENKNVILTGETVAKDCAQIEKKNFTCLFCRKEFFNRSHMIEHERIHTQSGEKPYNCGICSRGFKHYNQLKLHKQRHAKFFRCPTCQKGFSVDIQLQIYLSRDM